MKEEKIVVNAKSFELSKEEEEKLKEYMDYALIATKKLVLKYFDIKFYKDKPLANYEFAMSVYWAISRDMKLVPDSEHAQGLVLWRRLPIKKPIPKLLQIKEEGLNYLFVISYPTENKKRVRKTITIPKQGYEKFKEDFKDEINTLERKTYGNATA